MKSTTRDVLFLTRLFRKGHRVTVLDAVEALRRHRFADFIAEDVRDGRLLVVRFDGDDAAYRIVAPGDVE